MMKEEVKGPEVCKDPIRLTSYAVGANILKQGEDPQLKPNDQYPEWWVLSIAFCQHGLEWTLSGFYQISFPSS